MRFNHQWRAVAFSSALALTAVAAKADDEGFAINRFEPAERGSDWFTQDSINIAGHPRVAAGLTLDWAHKPLVLYDTNGDVAAAIVKDQVFAHLGASIAIFERVRLGINIPVALYSGGDGGVLDGTTFDAAQGVAMGDLRLGGDVLIFGKYRSPISVAAGAWFWIPTGSQDAFTGDGKIRLSPHAAVAGDLSIFAYSGRIAFDYRAQDQTFAGAEVGSDLTLGASAGVRLVDKKLLLGPELTVTTGVESGESFFGRETTPFELLFGAHYELLRDLRVGLGFGPGLSRGIGTPAYRGLLSVDWVQHVEEAKKDEPPSDRDGDGIIDSEDACPKDAGPKTDNEDTNGCPDSDQDGIIDEDDACPEEPGVASKKRKKHGCPLPKDNDKDGILDVEDACPEEAGVKTDDPKTNGCEPKDTDEDKIIDPEDACPTIKGKPNEDPKKNGCPSARVEQGQIRILERVEFGSRSAKLESGADAVLQGVLDILNERPDIKKLSIEGHTDDIGDDAYNKKLSEDRAEAVKTWLIKHGIDQKRVSAAGYGEEKPIDTNSTDAGRQNNRRVEFHIREVDDKSAPSTKKAGDK